MDLMAFTSRLLPEGRPDFRNVIQYPMIRELAEQHGRKPTLLVLCILVRDFAASVNVVRNVTEDQVIEIAAMLLDECDNFRLEDYVMMFSLAKRGKLGKIYDRLDISVVTGMLDEYWVERKKAGEEFQQEEVDRMEYTMPMAREMSRDNGMAERMDGFASALGKLKEKFNQWKK